MKELKMKTIAKTIAIALVTALAAFSLQLGGLCCVYGEGDLDC